MKKSKLKRRLKDATERCAQWYESAEHWRAIAEDLDAERDAWKAIAMAITVNRMHYHFHGNDTTTFNPARMNENDLCACGHPYYRHFDWMENNEPVGCKYCSCPAFEAAKS